MAKKSNKGEKKYQEENNISTHRYVQGFAIPNGEIIGADAVLNTLNDTATIVSGTTDAINANIDHLTRTIDFRPENLATVDQITQLEEQFTSGMDAIKGETSKLMTEHKSQVDVIIKLLKEEAEVLVSASLAKKIPSLETRVAALEENYERKRNWVLQKWVLAWAIIATIVAIILGLFF